MNTRNRCGARPPVAKCRGCDACNSGSVPLQTGYRTYCVESFCSSYAYPVAPRRTSENIARTLGMESCRGSPPLGFLRRSFDDGPVIIAAVAGFSEQGDPAVRIIMELGSEHPLLEQRLLLSAAIGVDLDEGAPWRQSFDFTERGDAFAAVEIVHRIERYHRLEALVGKRQLDGIPEMEPADDFRLAMHQRIFRDVEAEGLEAGTDLDQVLDQEALAAAYVEHAIAGLEVEVLHHVLGDRNTSSVVAVSAIAVLARPIEIELAIFARDRDDLIRLGLSAGVDVTLAARKLRKQIDFLLHRYAPSLATRASPSRSEI